MATNRKEYFSELITDNLKRNVNKMEQIINELKRVVETPETEIETKVLRYQEAINNLNNGSNISVLIDYFNIYKE